LSPGGSTHLHTRTTHTKKKNNVRTTQIQTNVEDGRVRSVPLLFELYPGICLTTDEKARKNLNQGKSETSVRYNSRGQTVVKDFAQSTVSLRVEYS